MRVLQGDFCLDYRVYNMFELSSVEMEFHPGCPVPGAAACVAQVFYVVRTVNEENDLGVRRRFSTGWQKLHGERVAFPVSVEICVGDAWFEVEALPDTDRVSLGRF